MPIKLEPSNGWICIDDNGLIMPWLVSPVLDILNGMDLKDKKIFEYGCGNSTLWFRSQGAEVYGVDSNMEWANKCHIPYENKRYFYLRRILKNEPFDIVVIDGEFRDNCTDFALWNTKKGGMIIIDNWMQPSVPPNEWFRTLDLLATKGLRYEVHSQEGHPDWKTMIIYND